MSLSPDLLTQLRAAGLFVEQHNSSSRAETWFTVRVRNGYDIGDLGPYHSAEQALVVGVRRLCRLLTTAEAKLHAERKARG